MTNKIIINGEDYYYVINYIYNDKCKIYNLIVSKDILSYNYDKVKCYTYKDENQLFKDIYTHVAFKEVVEMHEKSKKEYFNFDMDIEY
jgi:hypothetical protein